jgi:hypothetical protein
VPIYLASHPPSDKTSSVSLTASVQLPRAGAVSLISGFGPKVLVEGDHSDCCLVAAGDGADRCGCCMRRVVVITLTTPCYHIPDATEPG